MKLAFAVLTLGVLCSLPGFCRDAGETAPTPVIDGYVFPSGAVLDPGQIDAHNLNRINYAFASIQNGRLALTSQTDLQDLALVVALKKKNPSLSVLISVGGWLGSGNFSDMALTPQSRKIFIDSVMDFISHHDLDGLDIDWEYPGMPGAGHTFRTEDTQNFTLLLKELRTRLNKHPMADGRRLYLTIAAGASDEYLQHTQMLNVQRYVDAVNLMAYDFNEAPSNGLTGHQSALFTDPADPNKNSADAAVRAFQRAGVPAQKLILGVPFYGRAWEQVGSENNGLYQPGKPSSRDFIPYATIDSTMIGHGYTRYWDQAASAPYLYNPGQKIFVSFDDSESLAAKCSYVLSHKLGGLMFWKYSDDPGGELIRDIERGLHPAASTP